MAKSHCPKWSSPWMACSGVANIPFDSLTGYNFIQFCRHIDGRLDEWSKRVTQDIHQLNWVHHHILQLAAMSQVYKASTSTVYGYWHHTSGIIQQHLYPQSERMKLSVYHPNSVLFSAVGCVKRRSVVCFSQVDSSWLGKEKLWTDVSSWCMQPMRPTQCSILNGMRTEYQPNCSNAL